MGLEINVCVLEFPSTDKLGPSLTPLETLLPLGGSWQLYLEAFPIMDFKQAVYSTVLPLIQVSHQ